MPSAAVRAEARVDLAAVRANVAALRSRASGAELMAVVKADAYGHGLLPCARAAVEGGATWLGTAFLEEALALRAAGVGGRVLAWLAAPGESRYADAVRADVDLSASAPAAVREIEAAASVAGRPARLHLKADTGLSRGGAVAADWPELVAEALRAQAGGAVQVVGLWTHLACGDDPRHPANEVQLAAFREALAAAERAGVRPEVRHAANSGGTLNLPAAHFDLVRTGIAVYGISPADDVPSRDLGLRPAMTLAARLALVKRVPAGSGVSYGHTYVTDRETMVGLVPLGYADGVPRHASSRAEVLVGGVRRPVAGRVCMDQFVVDLGPGSSAVAGDEVLLFGAGERGEPTAADWARAAGTIAYEVVTRLGPRVPRSYPEASA